MPLSSNKLLTNNLFNSSKEFMVFWGILLNHTRVGPLRVVGKALQIISSRTPWRWWKNTCFVLHTKHMQWKINKSTSFAIDNMYYVNLRIQEQESVPWYSEFQNSHDQKFLRTLSIFTPIPLVPKKCGLSISFYEFVQGRMKESLTFTYKPFRVLQKSVCFFL